LNIRGIDGPIEWGELGVEFEFDEWFGWWKTGVRTSPGSETRSEPGTGNLTRRGNSTSPQPLTLTLELTLKLTSNDTDVESDDIEIAESETFEPEKDDGRDDDTAETRTAVGGTAAAAAAAAVGAAVWIVWVLAVGDGGGGGVRFEIFNLGEWRRGSFVRSVISMADAGDGLREVTDRKAGIGETGKPKPTPAVPRTERGEGEGGELDGDVDIGVLGSWDESSSSAKHHSVATRGTGWVVSRQFTDDWRLMTQ